MAKLGIHLLGFLKVPFYMKNWWLFFLDGAGLADGDSQEYRLYGGIRFKSIPRQGDGLTIHEIWGSKIYNPKGFEIQNDNTIVDIGAHRGFFSVFAAKKAEKGVIYAFEPIRENYLLLTNNIKKNKCKNVKYIQLGISSEAQTKSFYTTSDNFVGVSVIKDWFTNGSKALKTFKIKCISLDDVLSHYRIKRVNLLKIDCEGGEYDILLGTSKRSFDKIDRIAMEFHQLGKYNVKLLKKKLRKMGYRVKVIDEDKPIGLLYAKK